MKFKRSVLLSIAVFSVLFSTDYYTLSGMVTDPVTGSGLDSVLLKLFNADLILQDSALSVEGSYNITMTVTAMDPLDMPAEFNVNAYPNPVNPSLRLSFTIPRSGNYTIESFDLRGRRLTSYNRYFDIGHYATSYGGANTASGMQLVRISGEGYSKTVKVTFLDGGNGCGFRKITTNNPITKKAISGTNDLTVRLMANKDGYSPYDTLITLTPGNNIYNIEMTRNSYQDILKKNMFAAKVLRKVDSTYTSRIILADYSDFSNYRFITPDSIRAYEAFFSNNKENLLITYDYGENNAFCIYNIQTKEMEYLNISNGVFTFPVCGEEPIWDKNGDGIYFSDEMRMTIYYYDLSMKEVSIVYNEFGVSAYPIAMTGIDSILVFSNKYYHERHDNNCIFIMSPGGEYLSQIINPHLELINIGGINIKASYDIDYIDSTEAFVFAAYDSSSRGEFRIAVSNYDGSEYLEYTNSNMDEEPIFGPDSCMLFNRFDELTDRYYLKSVDMNDGTITDIGEKLGIPNLIYVINADF